MNAPHRDVTALKPAARLSQDPAPNANELGKSAVSGDLNAGIAQLGDLGIAELRERWFALYSCPAPKFFQRKLLIRAIAYQMQMKAYGGLPPATMRKLREIAKAARTGKSGSAVRTLPPRLKPGTRLIRVWQDRPHSVLVVEGGFEWDGQYYKSLSAVAKAITGTNWNGFAFFGVRAGASRSRNGGTGQETSDA